MKHRTKHEAEKADAGMTLGAAAMPLVKIHAEQKAGARRDYMTLETGVALDTWVPVASDDVAGLTKAHAALQSLVDAMAKASFNGATGKRAKRVRELLEAEAKTWKPGVPVFPETKVTESADDPEPEAASDSDDKKEPEAEESITKADVLKMSKKELKKFIKEHSLDIDPKEFDTVEELAEAVADEVFGAAAEKSDEAKKSDSDDKGDESDQEAKPKKHGKKSDSDSDSDSDKKSSDSDSDKTSDSDSDGKESDSDD